MKINFFEEFPKRGLRKLKLIGFPTTVYIAANSLKKYKKLIKQYKTKKIEFAYWPILKKEEGYWISAFSDTKAIKRVIKELDNVPKMKILWDAELPMMKKSLFVKNFLKINKNRRIIKEFLKTTKHEVITAEYAFGNEWLFNKLGLRNPNKNKRIYMMYSSHIHSLEKYLEKGKKRIGAGVIGKGILGTEKTISPKQLEKDLEIAKKNKVKEVTIFRLGGLDKEYIEIIKNYLD